MSILGIGMMAGGVLLLIWLYGPGHPSSTVPVATPGGSGASGFAPAGPSGPAAGSGAGGGGGGSW